MAISVDRENSKLIRKSPIHLEFSFHKSVLSLTYIDQSAHKYLVAR